MSLIAIHIHQMVHHRMLVIVQRLMELGKRALEIGEVRPRGSRWAEVGRNIEYAIEQIPLAYIKGETVKI